LFDEHLEYGGKSRTGSRTEERTHPGERENFWPIRYYTNAKGSSSAIRNAVRGLNAIGSDPANGKPGAKAPLVGGPGGHPVGRSRRPARETRRGTGNLALGLRAGQGRPAAHFTRSNMDNPHALICSYSRRIQEDVLPVCATGQNGRGACVKTPDPPRPS